MDKLMEELELIEARLKASHPESPSAIRASLLETLSVIGAVLTMIRGDKQPDPGSVIVPLGEGVRYAVKGEEVQCASVLSAN